MKNFTKNILRIIPTLLFNVSFSQTPSLVKDIYPGNKSAFYEFPAAYFLVLNPINNGVIFKATSSGTKLELWYSGGSNPNTYQLDPSLTLISEVNNSNYFGGKYYFTASSAAAGSEMFSTDGTSPGTTLLKDVVSGAGSSNPTFLFKGSTKFYFKANDGVNGNELFISDGTGTNTNFLKDLQSGAASSTISVLNYINTVNDNFYFIATTTAAGEELWFTDGTAIGTKLVQDINPGTGSFLTSPTIKYFKSGGNNIFFVANNGTNGDELWFSNGASATFVKDVMPGSGSSSISFLAYENNTLFFLADDGINGKELWRSDGTTGGTYLLHNLTPGNSSTTNLCFNTLNNKAYYYTSDSKQIWESDGTTLGTVSANIPALVSFPTSDYYDSELFKFNNALYFTVSRFISLSVQDSIFFYKLTSGLPSLTNFSTILNEKEIYTTCVRGNFDVINSTRFRYQYTYSASIPNLYSVISDGTTVNTNICGAVTVPMNFNCNVGQVIEVNNNLFFNGSGTLSSGPVGIFANSISTGAAQLLSSSIYPMPALGASDILYARHNNLIYFRGKTASAGTELFVSDGSVSGTNLVMDIFPGNSSAILPESPYSPAYEDYFVTASSGGKFFFLANNGVTGTELWCISGVTGINETANMPHASLFPNPATDKINIRSKDIMQTISVTDVLGKIMMTSEKVKENSFEINTSQLSSGIYFVNIEGSNGTQTVKFIKQ